jgi:hypothetical protein
MATELLNDLECTLPVFEGRYRRKKVTLVR